MTTTGKGIGRPKKKELARINSPGKTGRPPGHAAAINEFTARIINSPKSRKVMDAIVQAALDDDHKNQAAAWKLLMDRMVPISAFEKDGSGQKPTININIGRIDDAVNINAEEVIEAEDLPLEEGDRESS